MSTNHAQIFSKKNSKNSKILLKTILKDTSKQKPFYTHNLSNLNKCGKDIDLSQLVELDEVKEDT